MSRQLSLDGDSLVGQSWEHPEHGRCTVLAVAGDGARVQVIGEREFEMLWPVVLVNRELAAGRFVDSGPAPDAWVSDGKGSFHNATENRRLAALGLVPLAEPAGDAAPVSPPTVAPPRPESRKSRVPDRGVVMTVAITEKPAAKKSGLASLSKAKLRERLLATTTICDGAWIHLHGNLEREKGETREAFIKRVLA